MVVGGWLVIATREWRSECRPAEGSAQLRLRKLHLRPPFGRLPAQGDHPADPAIASASCVVWRHSLSLSLLGRSCSLLCQPSCQSFSSTSDGRTLPSIVASQVSAILMVLATCHPDPVMSPPVGGGISGPPGGPRGAPPGGPPGGPPRARARAPGRGAPGGPPAGPPEGVFWGSSGGRFWAHFGGVFGGYFGAL